MVRDFTFLLLVLSGLVTVACAGDQETPLLSQDTPGFAPVTFEPGTVLDDMASLVSDSTFLVFDLDGMFFLADSLRIAGPDLCSYIHVHGQRIRSAGLYGPNSEPIYQSEHLGECGYGPPNFFYIPFVSAGPSAGGYVEIPSEE